MYRRTLFAAAIAACAALPASASTILVVQTSDNVGGAGTDSNIYVRLFDGNGQSRRLRLQDLGGASGNILEAGDTDILTIQDDGIDTAPLRLQLESDGLYSGAAWHLDRVFAVTYDETDQLAAANALIVPSLLMVDAFDRATFAANGVHVSTFVYEDWIEGGETYMAEGVMQDGVMLVRQEPLVQPSGPVETVDTTIYVVYYADALDSATPVERAWETSISRNRSFAVSSEESQEGRFGASITAGYSPSDSVGGGYAEATISAEYAFLTSDANEQTWGTETSVETDDTFEAEPGTLQFRILETRGVVAQQVYDSLIQDETFRGLYIQEASPFVPRGVTFVDGQNGDTQWNRSVARAFAIANGEAGYDLMVERLRTFGILSQPQSYAQAIGN